MTFGAIIIVVEATVDDGSFDDLLSFQIFIGFFPDYIVVNIGVAAEALNFVSGNMVEMHLLAAVTAFKQMGFRVTLDADVIHNVTITVDYAEVALFTVYPPLNIVFMDERHISIGINEYFSSVRSVTGLAI